MRIGFISDLHGSLSAWESAVSFGLIGCGMVICCGDTLYHGPRNPIPDGYDPQGLARAINGSGFRMVFAKGNCDADVDQLLIDYPISSPIQVVYNEGTVVLAHHGDILKPEDQDRYTRTTGAGIVVSGHTHLRVLEMRDCVAYLNPGSPSLPKTADGIPTFALLDGNDLKIISASNGSVIESLRL